MITDMGNGQRIAIHVTLSPTAMTAMAESDMEIHETRTPDYPVRFEEVFSQDKSGNTRSKFRPKSWPARRMEAPPLTYTRDNRMLNHCCNITCDHPIKGIVRRLRKQARESGHADISGLPADRFLRHVWIHRSWLRPVINGGVGDVASVCELTGRSLAGSYPVFFRLKGEIRWKSL
jgi:hypothetical protein